MSRLSREPAWRPQETASGPRIAAIDVEVPMSKVISTVPFSIVVGLDFTDGGAFAFRQAARIARRIPGACVHLIHVFPESPSEEEAVALKGRLQTYVNEQGASVGGLAGTHVGIHLRGGDPGDQIVLLARGVHADLVILGARTGPHLKTWILGSIVDRLLRTAPCPVVVAGPKPEEVPAEASVEIEPPCADCEQVRTASLGATFWCARHANHPFLDHVFSYERELPLSTPDTLVTPAGFPG
jgi:nucleotide-binding universal stress UspA family protein